MNITVTLVVAAMTVLTTIAGWFIAHSLSLARDAKLRRHEQRISYLTTAYRDLASGVYLGHICNAPKVLPAIAEIYLFGNEEQIERTEKFIESIGKEQEAEIDPLLISLCNDLRKELKQSPLNRERLRWLVQTQREERNS